MIGEIRKQGTQRSSQPSPGFSGLQDDFMAILLTELKYQDPLEPMKDRDFFAQMAQFSTAASVSSLESAAKEGQIRVENTLLGLRADLLTIFEYLDGRYRESGLTSMACLMGHKVTAETGDGLFQGVVDSAVFENGEWFLKCGDQAFRLSEIKSVGGSVDAD